MTGGVPAPGVPLGACGLAAGLCPAGGFPPVAEAPGAVGRLTAAFAGSPLAAAGRAATGLAPAAAGGTGATFLTAGGLTGLAAATCKPAKELRGSAAPTGMFPS